MDHLRDEYPEKFEESGAMNWEWFEEFIRPNSFIYLREDKNSLTFNLQKGPIKEVGVNGCQVDTMIAAAHHLICGLDKNFSTKSNREAIGHLKKAYMCLKKRRLEREERGVEGSDTVKDD